MTAASVVSLPRGTVPKFPDRCVLCGRHHPGTTTFTTRDALKGKALWAGWYSLELPACKRCGWRLLLSQVSHGLVIVLLVALAAGGFGYVQSRASTGVALLSVAVLDLVAIWTYARWGLRHPPQFAVDPNDKRVAFEFRDIAQAQEFAAINGATVELPAAFARSLR